MCPSMCSFSFIDASQLASSRPQTSMHVPHIEEALHAKPAKSQQTSPMAHMHTFNMAHAPDCLERCAPET
uniref:Uncharacterized protein n=1 Tax=Panagrellus redivivus TaxID=6233 RepID=A0A7E4UU90_PANRE